jgi:hypothetical protein
LLAALKFATPTPTRDNEQRRESRRTVQKNISQQGGETGEDEKA